MGTFTSVKFHRTIAHITHLAHICASVRRTYNTKYRLNYLCVTSCVNARRTYNNTQFMLFDYLCFTCSVSVRRTYNTKYRLDFVCAKGLLSLSIKAAFDQKWQTVPFLDSSQWADSKFNFEGAHINSYGRSKKYINIQ